MKVYKSAVDVWRGREGGIMQYMYCNEVFAYIRF